jgi:mutator protein MutT
MPENKSHIAVGIVCHRSQVLLIERKQREVGSDGKPIIWAFPGGKVEKDESAEQAAVREVLEETGNSVVAVETIAEEEHPHYPVYISYVACELIEAVTDKSKSDPAIVDSAWVPHTSLKQYLSNHINEKVESYLDSHI